MTFEASWAAEVKAHRRHILTEKYVEEMQRRDRRPRRLPKGPGAFGPNPASLVVVFLRQYDSSSFLGSSRMRSGKRHRIYEWDH